MMIIRILNYQCCYYYSDGNSDNDDDDDDDDDDSHVPKRIVLFELNFGSY